MKIVLLENSTAEETAIEVLNNSDKYETVEIRIAYNDLMNDKSCSLDTKYHLCYKLKILYKERLEGKARR